MKKLLTVSIAAAILALVIGGVWWRFTLSSADINGENTADIPTPDRLIRFSGEIKAKQYARLGFEATGIAKNVAVTVGDTVEKDQELIVLGREIQEAVVDNAYANRVSARDNALVSLEAARSALNKTKEENRQTVAKARQKVIDSKEELDDAKEVFNRTASDDGGGATTTASKKLAVTTTEKAYNGAQEELTEARKTADKENTAAEEVVRIAEAAHTTTIQSSLTTPGTASLAALETSARVQLAKKILTAPFAGTITKVDLKPNELAIGGQPIITIQSINDLEIEAQVSEVDITKLNVGDEAKVTFDAFGDDQKWTATTTQIDPAGENIEGITRYIVYLDVEDPKKNLRPGFTANVIIVQ